MTICAHCRHCWHPEAAWWFCLVRPLSRNPITGTRTYAVCESRNKEDCPDFALSRWVTRGVARIAERIVLSIALLAFAGLASGQGIFLRTTMQAHGGPRIVCEHEVRGAVVTDNCRDQFAADTKLLTDNNAKVARLAAGLRDSLELIDTYRVHRTLYGIRESWREHGRRVVKRHWLRWW